MMKKSMPWNKKEEDNSSSSSSSSDTESEGEEGSRKSKSKSKSNSGSNGDNSTNKSSKVILGKRKGGGIDFEALTRHGYKGGLSVLRVPPPKELEKQDWTWSTGKERKGGEVEEESYKERQKTRDAIADADELATVVTRKDKKSFGQKEKRKRDLGQTSRGKSYVEEEKRLLRDNGVYSGFDC